ncbi:hypothetical protein AB1484_27280 [Parafrankia sp. FMc6]|uniref:hypothetical protein n=1 Tax=Parafrankia soli TaxID=2599596 RepID=UPI0034D47E28
MVSFSAPATGGARIEWQSVLGRLLVMVPIDVKKDVPTRLGDPVDVVVADVHILDGDRQGDWEPGVWVFPKVLKAQLEPKIASDGSELVLGRLIQEPTQKGNPAWKLGDPTAADVEAAQRWHAWRTNQGLPITSVGKLAAAPAVSEPAATSFDPTSSSPSLAEQVRVATANAGAGTGPNPWTQADDTPPF